MKAIYDFFKVPGYTLSDFKKDWDKLPEKDREQLKTGIADGTLNY